MRWGLCRFLACCIRTIFQHEPPPCIQPRTMAQQMYRPWGQNHDALRFVSADEVVLHPCNVPSHLPTSSHSCSVLLPSPLRFESAASSTTRPRPTLHAPFTSTFSCPRSKKSSSCSMLYSCFSPHLCRARYCTAAIPFCIETPKNRTPERNAGYGTWCN